MWHRRQHEKATAERASAGDRQTSVIWDAEQLSGTGSQPPVIKAPRAADLAASAAA